MFRMRALAGLSWAGRTGGGVLTGRLAGDGDLLRALPARRMRGRGERAQRAALVERDGEDDLRVREHGVQVDARDLGAILVERDVADEVLPQRREDGAGAHRDRYLEPLPPLHRVRRL